MPTETERSILKSGDSSVVAIPPAWLKFFEEDLKKHGKKVKVFANSLLVIVPPGNPELEAKARRIVRGKKPKPKPSKSEGSE